MPKIRMTVEYDPDWGEISAEEQQRSLEDEKQAWLVGSVGVWDIHSDIGTVTWEIIP